MPKQPFTRIHDREYFSGSQAALYIGDVFVDEVLSFAFSVNHTKTPIYGYASELYDAVSNGPVIVTGNFSINYKESAYLYLVLMRYKQFRTATDRVLAQLDPSARAAFNRIRPDKKRIPSPFLGKIDDQERILRQGIERVLQGQASIEEKTEFYNAIAGFAQSEGQDLVFEDIAEIFEDQVWGADPKDFENKVRRTDDKFFNGFDIYFTYGDYSNPRANHTVERITDVHLTSRSKAVNVSGEPIVEEYQFLAKDAF